ncbi:FCP1 homology domain [Dillenia turbinata]|uniref:Mitochondrial import inner membrane translocase subunit TIM50 n=1 Tax=Dillenia turbinata TaxID=194707 RepID=A0AAN8VJC0_9MAGN
MQTTKRISGRSSSRDHASPRVSRHQKKVSENLQAAERKVTELITSSARKQNASVAPKKGEQPAPARKLDTGFGSVYEQTSDNCLEQNVIDDASVACEVRSEETAPCVSETIFSPSFHITRNGVEENANGVDFIKFFRTEDHKFQQESISAEENASCGNRATYMTLTCPRGIEVNGYMSFDNSNLSSNVSQMLSLDAVSVSSCYGANLEGAGLSSEVSAIYLAAKNSKLECVDEQSHDSMANEICVEDEDFEDFDDFDPYVFIKNLPDLSSIIPTFRPVLLPKQTRSCPPTTLVLDLDERLVHSTLEPCDGVDFTFPVNFNFEEHTVYVWCRPYLKDFMERVAGLFEIIIFTASQCSRAASQCIGSKKKGNCLKDLSVLGRDLARVIIIDNSPQAFGFQVDNGIPIESWFDDRSDQELLLLLPFLESLVGVEDKFNLRQKIAAAACPSLASNRGYPLER